MGVGLNVWTNNELMMNQSYQLAISVCLSELLLKLSRTKSHSRAIESNIKAHLVHSQDEQGSKSDPNHVEEPHRSRYYYYCKAGDVLLEF